VGAGTAEVSGMQGGDPGELKELQGDLKLGLLYYYQLNLH